MKRRILEIVAFVAMFFMFFSCSLKEYNGFAVEEGMIVLPYDEKSSIPMPIKLYKELENIFKEFSYKYNYFADITDCDFETYRNITIGIYSLEFQNVKNDDLVTKDSLSKIIKSSRNINCITEKLFNESEESLVTMERFVQRLSDEFDVLIYVIGEIAEFDKGTAPWYESREAMFNDIADDKRVKNAILYIEKYFPDVKFVSAYEDIGFMKKNVNNS